MTKYVLDRTVRSEWQAYTGLPSTCTALEFAATNFSAVGRILNDSVRIVGNNRVQTILARASAEKIFCHSVRPQRKVIVEDAVTPLKGGTLAAATNAAPTATFLSPLPGSCTKGAAARDSPLWES